MPAGFPNYDRCSGGVVTRLEYRRHGTEPESRTQQIYVISVVPTTGWLVRLGVAGGNRTHLTRFTVWCRNLFDFSHHVEEVDTCVWLSPHSTIMLWLDWFLAYRTLVTYVDDRLWLWDRLRLRFWCWLRSRFWFWLRTNLRVIDPIDCLSNLIYHG